MTPPTANVMRCLRTALGDADGGVADATLLRRFVESRDPEAFELLVWRHAGMVLRVCRSRLHDYHAAEDASQAVFLALAKQAGAVSRRGTVAGWLYRVAWRVAAKVASRRVPQMIDDLDHVAAREAESVCDPTLVHALHEELARLPEKYRVPILLCFFEGLTHADAAKRLEWPLGTLAARIARGKELVHRRLMRRGITMPAAGLGVLIAADAAPAFVSSTVSSAVAFVSGTGANTIPPSILQLAQGAVRTMTVIKIRWAAGVLAACGAMVVGVAWAASGGQPIKSPVDPPPVAGAPVLPMPELKAEKPVVRTANSAQRKKSLENLKQLALAIHNYDAAYGHLPADIRDRDGKALLSWRVAILPFIEQDGLHRQFRLNESWDSEHNLKLLAKIPDALRVGFEPKDATHTHYQVFAGLGTPFGPTRVIFGAEGGVGGAAAGGSAPPGPICGTGGGPPPQLLEKLSYLPIKIAQIPDGTSNTFGVVEAGPAVAWTKPADIAFDAKQPLPKIVWPFTNSSHVSMLDGTAFAIKPDLDQKLLRIYVGMDDGLVSPSLKTVQARLPVETDADRAELKKLTERNEKLIAESEQLLKEQIELLKKQNATAADFTLAEEQSERLRQMIAELKRTNHELRSQSEPKPK
jgi:RNA polymerase sigma factor (sigma-70 family)